MSLHNMIDLSGYLKISGGYMTNNEFGEDGYCSSVLFQPRLALSGIPVCLSWNIIQAPGGPLQFGRFSLGFTKEGFKNYLNEKKVKSQPSFQNDSLQEYQSVSSQLSDMSYLQDVSNSNIEYRQLKNDSLSGNTSAMDEMKMDSLRTVLGEYESLNRRFHELKSIGTNYNPNLQGALTDLYSDSNGGQEKIKNVKGEAKAISDSMDAAELTGLSKTQKFLMRFEKISVGYDVLSHSKLSVISYPYTGAGTDYSYKGLIVGGSVGKHSPYYSPTSFSFSSGMHLPSSLTDKTTVVHVKAGLGSKDNSSILSLTNFSGSSSESAINNFDRNGNGQVITLLSEKKLSENSKVEVEISKSSSPEQESGGSNSGALNQIAINVATENDLPRLNAKVKFEYLNIGNDFHTPGNPYLSSGFQLLNICINKSMIKDRLSADFNIVRSWSTVEDSKDESWKRFSGSLGLKFKVTHYFSTFWKHFTNTMYSAGRSSTGRQNSESDQVTFSFIPGRKTSISITGFTGTSSKDYKVMSRNYMASSSFSLQHKKNSFTVQLNYYQTKTAHESINNSSVTVGDRLKLGKRWQIRLITGANFSQNNISSIVNYGVVYVFGKGVLLDLSGGVNSYFSHEGSTPAYSRFQTMGGMNINF